MPRFWVLASRGVTNLLSSLKYLLFFFPLCIRVFLIEGYVQTKIWGTLFPNSLDFNIWKKKKIYISISKKEFHLFTRSVLKLSFEVYGKAWGQGHIALS
jgi:hypothetical protein